MRGWVDKIGLALILIMFVVSLIMILFGAGPNT